MIQKVLSILQAISILCHCQLFVALWLFFPLNWKNNSAWHVKWNITIWKCARILKQAENFGILWCHSALTINDKFSCTNLYLVFGKIWKQKTIKFTLCLTFILQQQCIQKVYSINGIDLGLPWQNGDCFLCHSMSNARISLKPWNTLHLTTLKRLELQILWQHNSAKEKFDNSW